MNATNAMNAERLRAALAAVPDPVPLSASWLADGLRRVAAEPAVIGRLFAGAGRRCGRAQLPDVPGWTAADAARVLLLTALPPAQVVGHVQALYRFGDAAEKRAVLLALPLLSVGSAGVPLLHDALRTNDTSLVATALGPCAAHLDQAAWRNGVLKCVFTGVPLTAVADVHERSDGELAGMLAGLAEERRAAGRDMPADAAALLQDLSAGTPGADL